MGDQGGHRTVCRTDSGKRERAAKTFGLERALYALFVLLLAGVGASAQVIEVENIPLAAGGSQRAFFARPASPRAILIMLPGGGGNVGVDDEGNIEHGKNFLVRTRDLWLARGYSVLIVDALEGKNMRGLRSSSGYAQVIEEVVRFAHTKQPGEAFLVGTSQGSIAAMNGAAHLPKGQLNGLVLSESVTRPSKSGESVFDAAPERVTVPTLIVANRSSLCRVAPAEDAPAIAKALTNAPEVKIVFVEGGETKSRDCGSQSSHGYFGIETETVNKIAGWLDAH